jgi:hypothetical protein
MLKKILVPIGLTVSLAGCATPAPLMVTGGSPSDGTIFMSTGDFGAFSKRPVIDLDKAQKMALRRCASWGYSSAERFDAMRTVCTGRNAYGCVAWEDRVSYQCTNPTNAATTGK